MRTARIKVYAFSELSEEAKERAHRAWREEESRSYPWIGEVRDTVAAFEREFGVDVADWEFSSYDYDFTLDTSSIDDSVLGLRGNRARAWFWNHHGRCLMSPRTRYFVHDRDGKRIEAVGLNSVKFTSKVDYTRAYDGTCPWTGWFMDCDALDPIAHFCFGVEWDEREKRRVPSSRRIAVDDSNTVESLLHDSMHSLFRALRDDCRYQESMDAFAEACDANDYEFTEDGRMWLGTEAS